MKSVETTELSTRRGTFDRGDREYNMTPCHGGDRGFKSPRGRQQFNTFSFTGGITE
jgi:hypothetical protein